MPMRRKNEKLSSYVGRCIRVRQHEHPSEDVKQSTAICYSMARAEKYQVKPKKKKRTNRLIG